MPSLRCFSANPLSVYVRYESFFTTDYSHFFQFRVFVPYIYLPVLRVASPSPKHQTKILRPQDYLLCWLAKMPWTNFTSYTMYRGHGRLMINQLAFGHMIWRHECTMCV